MGQKVNPISFRLGITSNWDSRWYSKERYQEYLHQDLKIRRYLYKKLKKADISKLEIIRYSERIFLNIVTAKPGIVIGKKGSDIDILKKDLQKMTGNKVYLNIQELRNVMLSAFLVSKQIASLIESRMNHKRVMKKAMQNSLKAGVRGIKVLVSGRLGGSEMARREYYKEGRVPLHTLRANIDYGFSESLTKFGKIGVKVWLFKGEVFDR